MSKQHCIHLSALTLRIDEATIQVILSRYWRRSGLRLVTSRLFVFEDYSMSSSHHVTYPMREPLQGVG